MSLVLKNGTKMLWLCGTEGVTGFDELVPSPSEPTEDARCIWPNEPRRMRVCSVSVLWTAGIR
jgi:hypothetical protein